MHRRARDQLIHEPQTLLTKRKRCSLPPVPRDHVQHQISGVAQFRSQLANSRSSEESLKRQLCFETLANSVNDLRSQKRMTAQIKEAVINAHRLDTQHFSPDFRKQLFRSVARRN